MSGLFTTSCSSTKTAPEKVEQTFKLTINPIRVVAFSCIHPIFCCFLRHHVSPWPSVCPVTEEGQSWNPTQKTQPCPPCRWIFSGKGGLRCPQQHEQTVITRLGYHLHRARENEEGRTCVSQPAPELGVALPATEWCKHLDNRKTSFLNSRYTRDRAA